MKNLVILIIILFSAFLSFSQQPDCKKFKNGTFYYPSLENKLSVRKGDVQESYNNGVLEMVWKVTWLNECTYEMICTQVLVEPSVIKTGHKILATIIETDDECFTTSIVFYNDDFPEGKEIPGGPMCFKK